MSENPEQQQEKVGFTLGNIAYGVYGETVGGVNHLGNPMPEYEALPAKISEAWEVVGSVLYSLGAEGAAKSRMTDEQIAAAEDGISL